jgi:hypothetical protein
VPSEYELKAMQRKKEIAEYILKKLPNESKEVTILFIYYCFSPMFVESNILFSTDCNVNTDKTREWKEKEGNY